MILFGFNINSMIPKITFKSIRQIKDTIVLGLFVFGFSYSIGAQDSCDHLSINYNVNQWYYAIGINNNSLEESNFTIEIKKARYILEEGQFSNPNGINLSIESSQNQNGSYDYVLTPDQPIDSYQFLNFVYNGVPQNSSNNYNADADVVCSFAYAPLCANLDFNFFNESQYSFGFSIQNNNSTAYYPYEVYIDNATYQFDLSQLNYDGFDLYQTNNGNGTFDYYFLAQDPIQPYSSSPTVSTNQNLGNGTNQNSGNGITSRANTIQCGDQIVSSGISGGLESHGGMAHKIAQRNFKKAMGINTAPLLKIDNTIISGLAPSHIISGDQLIETSPTDLIDITTAETLWAGDYFINNTRFASIFGSKTSHQVYDHTKVICDRVKGSELAAVEVIKVGEYEMILSIIRRPNKTIEYAISFSLAYKEFGNFTMASNWAIDEYKNSPNFLNYQVWTNSKAKSIAAVKQIIDKVVVQNGYTLHPAEESPRAPELFARQAYYRLGAFHIELNNRLTEASNVHITGTCNTKEFDGQTSPFNEIIEIIPGQTTLKIELPSGNIFDGEISLKTANNQKDVIYLADGSWGLEYNENSTTVDKLEIIPEERVEETDKYLVERGISVTGRTDTYLSIFKQLVPGGLAVDLSNYNTFSFDTDCKGVYEVTLLMADNTDPDKNVKHTLKTQSNSSVSIPFALFRNDLGDQLDPSKITTIYIAFKESNNDQNEFDFTIENIRFENNENSNFTIVDNTKLNLFPNPTNGLVKMTHTFTENSAATIAIYNVKGSLVKKINTEAYKGLQQFEFNLDNYAQGLYVITLHTNEGVFTNTILFSK